jgi:transcriptional regulator with XRE-family HTH domain
MNNKQQTIEELMGRQLKQLRKEHYTGDSVSDFAIRIGVSKNTYSAMENGTGNVAFSAYRKAAQLYRTESKLLDVFNESGNASLFKQFPKS